jgi:hypothetical protein
MAWNDDETDDDDYTGFSTSGGDADTLPCPHCGVEIYDEAERCPECGKYLSDEDVPSRPIPPWIAIGVVICLVIVLAWVFGGWIFVGW